MKPIELGDPNIDFEALFDTFLEIRYNRVNSRKIKPVPKYERARVKDWLFHRTEILVCLFGQDEDSCLSLEDEDFEHNRETAFALAEIWTKMKLCKQSKLNSFWYEIYT